MADSIEENKWIILNAMANQKADTSGRISLTGKQIQETTNLSPAEINDAIEILESAGYLKLLKFLGTSPFLFGLATITSNGKNAYQLRNNKNHLKNEIQIPPHFTPAMKDMMKTSLLVFDEMKSMLLSSLTDAGKKYHLNNGLYYIVLIDLSGSTIAAGKMPSSEYSKWINGFIRIIKDALEFSHRNTAIYIKSIGDGSLFLFGNFDDILEWKTKVDSLCETYNQKCKSEQKSDLYLYYYKIIVHIGEVYFEEGENDTNSYAVNVVFKIEKQFLKNELGITEAVKQAIMPEINSGRFKIIKGNEYVLEEANVTIPLWKLVTTEN